MFTFQISNYDSPVLDTETAELLHQRLETGSRQAVPGLWKMTDTLNAYAAKGPGQEKRRGRYRIYGVLLIALGIFLLVPSLVEPRTPALICAGSFSLAVGIMELGLAREKKQPSVPASCQREAKRLLAGRRAVDWSKSQTKICFDETGMTVSSGGDREDVPYNKMTGIFETEHLWLLVYDGEKALLLQKKDLVAGDASEFFPSLLHKIELSQDAAN